MVLKKLTIEHFGKIKRFEASFHEQLTEISDSNTNDIIQAIGLITRNKSLTGHVADNAILDMTYISMELEIAGHPYLITARGQPYGNECDYEVVDRESNTVVDAYLILRDIRLCEEEESLVCYRYNPKDVYAERFLRYKDPDKYYPVGDFQKRTNGLGLMRSFRACLTEYIKKYEPSDLFTDGCLIKLCSDGRFVRCDAKGSGSIADPNEFNKLFDYKCFLDVNDFWSCFEDIRDMNHEKWPLIIDAEELQEQIEFKELLKKTSLGRQMIVMNTYDEKQRENGMIT